MFFVATGVSYAQDKDILTDQGVVLAKSFDTTKLSKRAGFNVRFSAGDGKYAFDEGREAWYQNAKLVRDDYYKPFGENYIAPWKLVPLGQTDSVEAVLAGAADVLGKLDRSKIKFVTADGKGVAAKDDGTKWVLTVPSTEAGKTTCDIFAVYQKSKSKLQTVGKLRVVSYEKQQHSVTLVPVGVDAPNVGEVQKRLNAIYAPYGVEFSVGVDDAIKELEGWKGRAFKLEGNGFFTRENADMAEIRKAYQNASSVDKDEYYIFVLGGADTGSEDGDTQAHGAQGDMPRGTQFGYVFSNRANDIGWLLAHELGHGVFTLKHLNESNYAGKSSLGTLPNLMDYTGSTALAAFQWNVMSNPAILTALDADEASKFAIVKNNIVNLNGLTDVLINTKTILSDKTSLNVARMLYAIRKAHSSQGSGLVDISDLFVIKPLAGGVEYETRIIIQQIEIPIRVNFYGYNPANNGKQIIASTALRRDVRIRDFTSDNIIAVRSFNFSLYIPGANRPIIAFSFVVRSKDEEIIEQYLSEQ